jgi:hypothetical protein
VRTKVVADTPTSTPVTADPNASLGSVTGNFDFLGGGQ